MTNVTNLTNPNIKFVQALYKAFTEGRFDDILKNCTEDVRWDVVGDPADGPHYGVRTGQKMRGERLRLLLGLLVFAVGLRFAYELVVQPDDLYSIRYVRGE